MIGSYTSLALAAGPLGLLAFGPIDDAFGPAVGFLLIGVGCVLAALLAAISRGLRGLGRPTHGLSDRPDVEHSVRPPGAGACVQRRAPPFVGAGLCI